MCSIVVVAFSYTCLNVNKFVLITLIVVCTVPRKRSSSCIFFCLHCCVFCCYWCRFLWRFLVSLWCLFLYLPKCSFQSSRENRRALILWKYVSRKNVDNKNKQTGKAVSVKKAKNKQQQKRKKQERERGLKYYDAQLFWLYINCIWLLL